MASASNSFHDETYILKMDLQGFFMSLNRQKLFAVTEAGLRKQFIDDGPKYRLFRFLWKQIIFDDPTVSVKRKGRLSDWDSLPESKSMFNAKPGCETYSLIT